MRYGKWLKRIGIVLMVIALAVALDRLDRYEQKVLESIDSVVKISDYSLDEEIQPATMSELTKQYVGQSYQF